MSSRIGGHRLAVAFARHQRAQAVALMIMGFALAVVVLSIAIARSSAQEAIKDSLRADLGHRQYALQTGNTNAIAILRGLKVAAPVQDQGGDVWAGDLTAPVSVRTTTDASLTLGVLADGLRPEHAGDMLLSESTARALNISLGQTVSVRVDDVENDGRVVGYIVDPADANSRTLIRLVDRTNNFVPTRWLSNTDFYRIDSLRPFLDSRTATYRSLDTLLEDAAANRPQFLSAMRFLPAGCGLLLAVVLLSVVVVMSRSWKNYADALAAAGMPRGTAWRRILWIIFGFILFGEAVGVASAAWVLFLYRGYLSGRFGQHWEKISVPAQEPIFIFGLTILFAALAAPILRMSPTWAAWLANYRYKERPWSTPLASTVAGISVVAWILTIRGALQPGNHGVAGLVPIAAAVMIATVPFLVSPVLGRGLPLATQLVFRHIAATLLPIASVGAAVVLVSSVWSAQTVYDANIGEASSSALEPAGSFVISEMPNSAIGTLASTYRSEGGGQVISYQIPDESRANLRVTSTELVSCMSRQRTTDPDSVPDSCFPQMAASPINTVMIGASGSAPRADPHLLQNGKVGLLLFHKNDGKVAQFADTHASPDPVLGGNLPGLVVPPESNVLKEFGLAPGGTSVVVLLDFDHLTPHAQVFVRSATLRLAPGAQTADGTDPTAYDRLRSVANTVSVLGALAAVIVLLLGGMSMVVAHALIRRTLADLGAASRLRWGFIARLTAVPTLTAALAIPLAIVTASFGGHRADSTYGHLWLLPGVLAVIASVAIGAAFLRVPESANE